MNTERYTVHSDERRCQIGYAATPEDGFRKLGSERGYVFDTELLCHVFPKTKAMFFESIRESNPAAYALWQFRESLPPEQDAVYWALSAGIAAAIGGNVDNALDLLRREYL